MTEETTTGGQESTHEDPTGAQGAEKRDLSWHLERIWGELKDITRQLENETRRGGRIARLRFEMRGLRQDLEAEAARIGHLVYDAQMEGGKRPALARVAGYDEAIERMAAIEGRVQAMEEEIAELRRASEAETTA